MFDVIRMLSLNACRTVPEVSQDGCSTRLRYWPESVRCAIYNMWSILWPMPRCWQESEEGVRQSLPCCSSLLAMLKMLLSQTDAVNCYQSVEGDGIPMANNRLIVNWTHTLCKTVHQIVWTVTLVCKINGIDMIFSSIWRFLILSILLCCSHSME